MASLGRPRCPSKWWPEPLLHAMQSEQWDLPAATQAVEAQRGLTCRFIGSICLCLPLAPTLAFLCHCNWIRLKIC